MVCVYIYIYIIYYYYYYYYYSSIYYCIISTIGMPLPGAMPLAKSPFVTSFGLWASCYIIIVCLFASKPNSNSEIQKITRPSLILYVPAKWASCYIIVYTSRSARVILAQGAMLIFSLSFQF